MAKVSAIQKNKHRARKAEQLAAKRAELKKIIYNRDLPFEERFEAQVALAELPRNSSKTRLRNRCELTGRPRGFYRKMRISRIALRDLASSGELPGVVKSSW